MLLCHEAFLLYWNVSLVWRRTYYQSKLTVIQPNHSKEGCQVKKSDEPESLLKVYKLFYNFIGAWFGASESLNEGCFKLFL